MSKRIRKVILYITVFVIFSFEFILAGEQIDKVKFEAGAGTVYGTDAYGDKKVMLIPFVNARYGRAVFEFDKAKLYITDKLSFFAGMGNEGSNLSGMKKRKAAIKTGFAYEREIIKGLAAGVEVYESIFDSKTESGCGVYVQTGVPLSDRDFIMVKAGVVYIGEAAADYYYGVMPDESSEERAAYHCGDAIKTEIQTGYMRIINSKMYAIAAVTSELYSEEINDSLITDKNAAINLAAGICYKFK